MFRIDFGWCMLENVEELLLSVLLRAWAWACVRSLDSCIRSSMLVYASMFLRSCVRGDGPAYEGSCLRTWALTCICEMPSRSPTLPIFTPFFNCFTSICNPIPPLCHFCTWISLYPSFYLHSWIKNIIFIISAWIKNLKSSFIFYFFYFFAVEARIDFPWYLT